MAIVALLFGATCSVLVDGLPLCPDATMSTTLTANNTSLSDNELEIQSSLSFSEMKASCVCAPHVGHASATSTIAIACVNPTAPHSCCMSFTTALAGSNIDITASYFVIGCAENASPTTRITDVAVRAASCDCGQCSCVLPPLGAPAPHFFVCICTPRVAERIDARYTHM